MTFYRRDLPHLQRHNKRHFVTFVTRQRWNLPPEARAIVLGCCTHDHGMKIDLDVVVVMPDHVHLLFTPVVDKTRQRVWSLAEIMDAIKGASAHLVNRALTRRGHVWQDESFDHVLRSSESVDKTIRYILDNPLRRGLARRPGEYPWYWVKPELADIGLRVGQPRAATPT